MPGQLQSLKTAVRDVLIGLFGNIFVAFLFGFGLNNFWWGILSFCFLMILTMGYLILKKYERFLKVMWSGAHGYYYTFPVEENKGVWEKVNRSFMYLGISSDSILPRFKDWVESLPENSTRRFYFLLMSPGAKALNEQISHQKALDPNDPQVSQEVEPVRKRIISSIEMLKNLEIYKEGRLKIKIYDEFIPWWMYVFDQEEIFLGILPKGKSGLDSPVLVIKENKQHPTLFNPFLSTWERMWSNAKDA